MSKKNFGSNLSGLLVFFKDSLHQNFIFLNSLFETQHKLTWTALFVDCNGAVPTNHMFLQSGYSWTSFKGKYFSRTKAVTPVLQSTQFRYDDRVITCQGYCILQFWSSRTKRDIMKRSKEKSSMDRRYSKFSRTNWYLHANLDKLRASSYERGQPGWLGVRDLASPPFFSQKFSCVHMRSRVAPVTDISVFATEIAATGRNIFPYEHSHAGDRDETFFEKIASLSHHSGQKGVIFALYVFPLQTYAN